MANSLLSILFTLTISFAIIGVVISAPAKARREKRESEASTESFVRALANLLNNKEAAMALSQLSSEVERQDGTTWRYPAMEESDRDRLSPSEKAARRHFKVSEPGTGPILNHPEVGVDQTLRALIKQLLSDLEVQV